MARLREWFDACPREVRGIFIDDLAAHLARSGQECRLHQLLLDYEYLELKLVEAKGGIDALISDFNLEVAVTADNEERKEAAPATVRPHRTEQRDLVAGALRLARDILARDPCQLAAQLLGWLDASWMQDESTMATSAADDAGGANGPPLYGDISQLRVAARALARRPSWLPMTSTFEGPGGALIGILSGHPSEVTCLALTPDGKRAVSGSVDSLLRVWDLEHGTCIHALTGDTDGVTCFALTPDGKRAVSGSVDSLLRVWDLEHGTCIHALTGDTDGVTCFALTPDGKRAVSGSVDSLVRVWDLEHGTCIHALTGHTDWVTCLALTPDGKRAVSGSTDDTLRVWDLEHGTCVHALTGHTDRVECVALTPDGKRAVSGSTDGALRIWDVDPQTGGIEKLDIGPHRLTTIAARANGRMIAVGDASGAVHFIERVEA